MSLAWMVRSTGSVLLATLAITVSASGCSESPSSGDGGAGGYDPGAELSFEHIGTLELGPLEERSVALRAQPGATVRLYLLGEAFDASINRTTATTDGAGRASFVLRAPARPATFRLRATSGESTAELPVAVSERGFAALRVTPLYAGSRNVESWTASVLVDAKCVDVLANFPDDPEGALRATAPVGADPVVESVPVGAKLAVAIRSGALVAGCVETSLAAPGSAKVEIEVIDRPVVLAAAELALSLGFSVDPYAYAELSEQSVEAFIAASFPARAELPGALLDAIGARLDGATLVAFDAHRASAQLDLSLDVALDDRDARALLTVYAPSAVSFGVDDASLGLDGRITGLADGTAQLELTWFGSQLASDAGFWPSTPSWKVDPGDVLLVSGSVPWAPSRHARGLLEAAVLDSVGRRLTEELSLGLDCATIGDVIAGFAGCDAACAATLCVEAIADRVAAAAASSDAPTPSGKLDLVMSGALSVDAELRPTALAGSWIGTISAGAASSAVEGAVAGSAPPLP
jgi:hypothetical protein